VPFFLLCLLQLWGAPGSCAFLWEGLLLPSLWAMVGFLLCPNSATHPPHDAFFGYSLGMPVVVSISLTPWQREQVNVSADTHVRLCTPCFTSYSIPSGAEPEDLRQSG
jgi:hypothetical protein